MPSHGAPITTMPYRSTSGSRQRVNTIGIDNIRVIAGPIIYDSRVGSVGRVRHILVRGALGFKSTTGGVGRGGSDKNGEEGEEEEDGESRSGDGARHCR